MSDSFAQLNALLSAAAAQQQKQSENQQGQPFIVSQKQQQQQQQFFQQLNQVNQLNQHQQSAHNPATASSFLNQQNLSSLNEQPLQALLYAQSLQKNLLQNSIQQQRNQNNMLQNKNFFSKDQKSNFDLSQIPLPPTDNELFHNENSFFHSKDETLFHNTSLNLNPNQQHQIHAQQNEPQTRVLEPYFSDDSPLNSLEHQLNMANLQRENQNDILNDFQKISLNESNSKMNNSNHNNSHHNTSSNFDNSIFSLNDSDIYTSDQNYMPGTASLIEDVDKQIMVVLRDGRTLIGYLRSIDQYANLLLSSTFERIHVGNKYGDIPKGIYIIRGENVVLIGEVDFKLPVKVEMCKIDSNEILELQRIEQKTQENEKNQKKALLERCAIPNTDAVLDEYY